MIDIFRYTAIAEDGARILNPLSPEKLLLLGDIAELQPGMQHLDLASGKGEMLCQYAARHGVRGIGIDIHPPFVAVATGRAAELGVESAVEFRVGDAGTHGVAGRFDVVSCIGATWIGGGFAGALELMRASVEPGGLLMVGEVFTESAAPPDAEGRHNGTLRGISDLGGILDRVGDAGLELVEMVLASRDDWDRYSSRHWDRADRWVRANPHHADAADVRAWTERTRRAYLADERAWLGWGVFVLRA